jgi:glutathione synthase/RimK-type ligase-like ATP-grasp enzyme
MKDLYIIVDNDQYFAHHIAFDRIEVKTIVDYFKDKNLKLNIITLKELTLNNIIKNSIVFAISSQKPYHKQYVDDIMEVLSLHNNVLVPSKNILRCHENKGYQEYYKKIIGIDSLEGYYFNNDTVNYDYIRKTYHFPLVLKQIDGSGSRGVVLVKSEDELRKEVSSFKISTHVRFMIYCRESIFKFFKLKYNRSKLDYYKDHSNFVIQEFVPNLKFDYKVLIFFDRYYVLKRNIKENDFRASGSGNFEFVEIEDSLLEYAKNIFEKINEPFMSLDICFDGEKYYLIEYQGIHFGQYTQLNADGYYNKNEATWIYIKEKESLEDDLAYSLFNHLIKNKLINNQV